MNLKYFDIHSHIQFPQFNKDKDEVLKRMEDDGVGALVVGTDLKSSESAIKEVAGKENLFATAGLHPNDVFKEEFDRARFTELAKNEKIVAIGECGLDYFRSRKKESGIRQKEVFEAHISLATELNKPLMVHCRDAHEDMLQILNSYFMIHDSKLKGNIHFFTGTKEIAKKYFDIGFTVSFTGVLTFTHDYDEVVEYAPLDMIMSETDCPFAAPVPYRGQRNEPVYVKEVVKRIAEIRGDDFEIVREALVQNALRMFAI
mgnify:CR=1 FL=1